MGDGGRRKLYRERKSFHIRTEYLAESGRRVQSVLSSLSPVCLYLVVKAVGQAKDKAKVRATILNMFRLDQVDRRSQESNTTTTTTSTSRSSNISKTEHQKSFTDS